MYGKTAVFRITRALEHFCREGVQMLRSTPLRSEDCMVKHGYFAPPERWSTFVGKRFRCLDPHPLGARIVWQNICISHHQSAGALFCREGIQILRSTPLKNEDCMVKHRYFASPERWSTFAGKGFRCLDPPPLEARII